jgi:hypothetical protein
VSEVCSGHMHASALLLLMLMLLLHSATIHACVIVSSLRLIMPLFVLAFWSFWPPKAAADCQTLSFSISFYKIRLGKNHSKST